MEEEHRGKGVYCKSGTLALTHAHAGPAVPPSRLAATSVKDGPKRVVCYSFGIREYPTHRGVRSPKGEISGIFVTSQIRTTHFVQTLTKVPYDIQKNRAAPQNACAAGCRLPLNVDRVGGRHTPWDARWRMADFKNVRLENSAARRAYSFFISQRLRLRLIDTFSRCISGKKLHLKHNTMETFLSGISCQHVK